MTRVALVSMFAVAYAAYCALAGGHPRLLMFAAGILLYEAIQANRRAPAVGVVLLILTLAFTNLLFKHSPTLHVIGLMVGYGFLCWACFQDSSLAAAFSWTPLRWLGNMSYSYYLLHGLALKFAFQLLGPLHETLFWTMMPVLFAWTILPSAALFLMVERPFSLARSVRQPLTCKETSAPVVHSISALSKRVARTDGES